MINPKNQISNLYYQTQEQEHVLIEKYTGRPKNLPTNWVGFYPDKTITVDDVEYRNPLYGVRLPDANMKDLFPHVKITYGLKRRAKDKYGKALYWDGRGATTDVIERDGEPVYAYQYIEQAKQDGVAAYVDFVTGKIVTDRRPVVKLVPVNGGEALEKTLTVANKPAVTWGAPCAENDEAHLRFTITEYLWLDNLVQDGDVAIAKEDIAVIEGLTVGEQYSFARSAVGEDSRSYAEIYRDSLTDSLMEMIVKGKSFEDALKCMPWFTMEGSALDGGIVFNMATNVVSHVRGEEPEISDSDTNVVLSTLFTEENLTPLIIEYLNNMLKEYAEEIDENIVKKNFPTFSIVLNEENGFLFKQGEESQEP